MPTKKKIPSSSFSLQKLAAWIPKRGAGIEGLVDEVRTGGRSYKERVDQIFDPAVDLASLKIGYFDDKIETLPKDRVPASEEELHQLCRRMVDAGGDEFHIRLMLQRMPGGFTLDQHVSELWLIKESDALLFEDIVRGVHAQAILRYKRTKPATLPITDLKCLLARQGLIWCALDAQLAITSARLAIARPFGEFISGDGLPLGGTVIRLMRRMLAALEHSSDSFQNIPDLRKKGKQRPGRQKPEVKRLAYDFEKLALLPALLRSVEGSRRFRRESLDAEWLTLRRSFVAAGQMIDGLERYNLKNGVGTSKLTNKHRTFQQIWHRDLSLTASAALSLMRFAQAEQHIERMVDEAFGPLHRQGVKTLLPMKPPPAGLHRSSPLIVRTLDLLYSARRAQLEDKDRVSRTPDGQASEYRDPDDMAGLTSALAAYETLRASGRRHPDLGRASSKRRKRQLSDLHLDVVPEARLYLIDAPDAQTLG